MTATPSPPADDHRFHRLRSLSVIGGFLDGMQCDFTDGLNCLIGARGTGKTTAVEFVRYAMDTLPDRDGDGAARRRIESLVQNNLAGGRIQVAIETRDGLRYVVSRTAGEDPIVLTPDGEPTELTLRSGGVFKADIYSQNEVESIADDTASQLELLDSFEGESLAAIGQELAQARAALVTNAGHILPLQDQMAAIDDELATLPGVEEKLKALSGAAGEDSEAINAAHGAKALRDREQRAMQAVSEFLDDYATALADLSGMVGRRAPLLIGDDVLRGPNAEHLRDVQDGLRWLAGEVEGGLSAAVDRVREVQGHLAKTAADLSAAHDRQEIEFRQVIEKHQEAQGQAAERTRLERLRNDLLAKKRKRQELADRLRGLLDERRRRLDQLSELRDRRFAVRQKVAERINAALSPTIRVRVEQFGDASPYQRLLEEALRDAGIQRNVVAQKLASGLAPDELSRAVQSGDARVLVDRAGINEKQATSVVATLSGSKVLFDLQTVELADRPSIELKDGETYKDSLSLSTGQKCTAILPILLLDSENPLVIDQPEDNLDNGFIYETVVRSIQDVKQRRQLIFVTHNPNIPVLGDAERVFVLDSDGASAHKANEGTVDECKEEIVTLLEGGEEAFKERRRRYDY